MSSSLRSEYETTHKLADEPAGEPQPTGAVEERRELRGDAAVPTRGLMSMSMSMSMSVSVSVSVKGVPRGDVGCWGSTRDTPGRAPEEHAVDLLEVIRGEERVLWLERRPAVHRSENLLGKRLLAADQRYQRRTRTPHLVTAHIW
jgi:hypothetical protein